MGLKILGPSGRAGSSPAAGTALRVRTGEIAALRLFDLAYAIDIARAETRWAERHRGPSARSRLVATPPKAVAFDVPPLSLDLGPVELHGLTPRASVRLYDFGIAALALRVPAGGLDWAAYTRLANALDEAVDTPEGAALLAGLRVELTALLGDALDRPTAAVLEEDHLIASVEAFDRPLDADELLEALDLAPLLSGDVRPLSATARADLLRQQFSYHADDLAVITWDRAFLYQPDGDGDVAGVLELANAQLLEMRVYDELLDAELPRLRAPAAAADWTAVFKARRYAREARRLRALVAEVTELTERVDNALQVTEDVYLARVYAAAIELFRVPRVGEAVDRKLAIIRETYAALQAEADGRRAELLELTVIALIATEIVLSLVRH